MALHYPALPLPRQLMQQFAKVLANCPEERLFAPLRDENNVVLMYAIHEPHLPKDGLAIYRGISGEQFHGNNAS